MQREGPVTRYEFTDSGSSKFWQVELAGAEMTLAWGKIGTSGQTKTKTFNSPEDARKEHDKLVAEKVKKGYQRVGAPAVAAPAAPSPYTAIIVRYRALAKACRDAGFKVSSAIGEAATEDAIARAEAARELAFPETLKALLRVADGISLEVDMDPAPIYRDVRSTTVYVESGTFGGEYFDEHDDEDAPGRSFIVVDAFSDMGAYGFLVGAGDDPTLTRYYEEPEPTELTLYQYLERMVAEDEACLAAALAARGAPKVEVVQPGEPALVRRIRALIPTVAQFQPGTQVGFATDSGSGDVKQITLDFNQDPDAQTKMSDALMRLAPGAIEGVETLVVRLPYLDSLAWLRAFPGVTELELHVRSGRLPADLADAEGLSSLSFTGPLNRYSPNDAPTAFEIDTLRLPPSLRSLALTDAGLDTVPRLSHAHHLETLQLHSNRIKHLAHLEGLSGLTWLCLQGNPIQNIAGIESLPKLRSLDLGDTGLTHLPVLCMPTLTSLNLFRNALKDLPSFAGCPALMDITVYENKIRGFDWLETVARNCSVNLIRNELKPALRAQLAARFEAWTNVSWT